MARTGQFGRLPKSAPDLAATIVGLMREYQAQVDQNMVDAWQNGGEVDGKPVTDHRLLAHLKSRRDELDKSDPQYQLWDNRITQYTFAIESSKMTVKWDNHQATEGDMAAFFHKWEKKTPDNTEFDRTLRSAYGKWANAASSRSAAGGARARAAAHDANVASIYNKSVKPGETLGSDLVWLAQHTGIITASQGIGDTQLSQGDMDRLLDLVGDGKSLNPGDQQMIDAVTTHMRSVDPNFRWDKAYIQSTFDKADSGFKRLVDGSTNADEAKGWAKRRAETKGTANRTAALSTMADIKTAREQWESDMKNAADHPEKQREITRVYLAKLEAGYAVLTKGVTVTNPGDVALIGPLGAEINGVRDGVNGKPVTTMGATVFDSTSGTNAGEGQDAQSWPPFLNTMNANREVLKNGGWVEPGVNPETGKPSFVFHEATDKPNGAAIAVPGGVVVDGLPVTMWVTPVPVTVASVDPVSKTATGAPAVVTDAATAAGGSPIDPYTNLPLTGAKGEPKPTVDTNAGFSSLTFIGSTGDQIKVYMAVAADDNPVFTLAPPLIPGRAEIRTEGAKAGTGGQDVVIIKDDRDPTTKATAGAMNPKDYNSIASLPTDDKGLVHIHNTTISGAAGTGSAGTYQTGDVPGAFSTITGARLTADLVALDLAPKTPAYLSERPRIIADMANAPATLTAFAASLTARGYPNEAAAVLKEAALVTSDYNAFHNATTNNFVLQSEAWLNPANVAAGRQYRTQQDQLHQAANEARSGYLPPVKPVAGSDWGPAPVDRTAGYGSPGGFGGIKPVLGPAAPALKLPTWGASEPGSAGIKLASTPGVFPGAVPGTVPGYHGFGGPPPNTPAGSVYTPPVPGTAIASPKTSAAAVPKAPPAAPTAATSPTIAPPTPPKPPPTAGHGPYNIPV